METSIHRDQDALWHVLARIDDSPEARALAQSLQAPDRESVVLVRALHRRLARESSPEQWLDSQPPTPREWDAALEWAADRGRQANVLADWLSENDTQSSPDVEERSSVR